VYEVNGPQVKSMNDFGVENVKTVIKPAVNSGGKTLTYTFPAHSFTLLKGKVTK
jgi:alpha-N-arabinofuranosidase